MKIRNIALNSLFYFLYMFGACVAVMVVEALFVYIVERFVILPYPAVTAIRVIIYSLGVPAIMAAIGYFEGYRESTCPVGDTVAGGLLAMVYHFIFSLLFNFQAFVSGAVRFTAGLIAHGSRVTDTLLALETPFGLTLPVFLLYGLIYVGALTIARYLGAGRRVMDRAELCRK